MSIDVEKWVHYEDAQAEVDAGKLRDLGSLGGWFQDGMRWKDYLERGPVPAEHAEAVRRSVLEKQLREDGGFHQGEEEGVPVFTDGATALLSMRAWGDLMAAIWSEHDNRDYNYMDFYYGGVSARAQGKT